jgi:hypothetical protein
MNADYEQYVQHVYNNGTSQLDYANQNDAQQPALHNGVQPALHNGVQPALHNGVQPALHNGQYVTYVQQGYPNMIPQYVYPNMIPKHGYPNMIHQHGYPNMIHQHGGYLQHPQVTDQSSVYATAINVSTDGASTMYQLNVNDPQQSFNVAGNVYGQQMPQPNLQYAWTQQPYGNLAPAYVIANSTVPFFGGNNQVIANVTPQIQPEAPIDSEIIDDEYKETETSSDEIDEKQSNEEKFESTGNSHSKNKTNAVVKKRNKSTKTDSFFKKKIEKSDISFEEYKRARPFDNCNTIDDSDVILGCENSTICDIVSKNNKNVAEILNCSPFESEYFIELIRNMNSSIEEIAEMYKNYVAGSNSEDARSNETGMDIESTLSKQKMNAQAKLDTPISGRLFLSKEESIKNAKLATAVAIRNYDHVTALIDQLVTFRNVVASKHLNHIGLVLKKHDIIQHAACDVENNTQSFNDAKLPMDLFKQLCAQCSALRTNSYGFLSFCDIVSVNLTCKAMNSNILDICFWDNFKKNILLTCYNNQLGELRYSNKKSPGSFNFASGNIMYSFNKGSNLSANWDRLSFGNDVNYDAEYAPDRRDSESANTEKAHRFEKIETFLKRGCKSNNMSKVSFLNELVSYVGFGVDLSSFKISDRIDPNHHDEPEYSDAVRHRNFDSKPSLDDILKIVDHKNTMVTCHKRISDMIMHYEEFVAAGNDNTFKRERSIMFGSTRLFNPVLTYDAPSDRLYRDDGVPKFFMDQVYHHAPQIYCNRCRSHVSGCLQLCIFWDETLNWCIDNNHLFGVFILALRSGVYRCNDYRFSLPTALIIRGYLDFYSAILCLREFLSPILDATPNSNLQNIATGFQLKVMANVSEILRGIESQIEKSPQKKNHEEHENIERTSNISSQYVNERLLTYVKTCEHMIKTADYETILSALCDLRYDPAYVCTSFKNRVDEMGLRSDTYFETHFATHAFVALQHCVEALEFTKSIALEVPYNVTQSDAKDDDDSDVEIDKQKPTRRFSCNLTKNDFEPGDFSNPIPKDKIKRRGKKPDARNNGESTYDLASNVETIYDAMSSDRSKLSSIRKVFVHFKDFIKIDDEANWLQITSSYDLVGSDFFMLRKCYSRRAADYDRRMTMRSQIPKVQNVYGSYAPSTSYWLVKSNNIIPTAVDFDSFENEKSPDPYAIWLHQRLEMYPSIRKLNEQLDPKYQKTYINYLKNIDPDYTNQCEQKIAQDKLQKEQTTADKKRKREENKLKKEELTKHKKRRSK